MSFNYKGVEAAYGETERRYLSSTWPGTVGINNSDYKTH